MELLYAKINRFVCKEKTAEGPKTDRWTIHDQTAGDLTMKPLVSLTILAVSGIMLSACAPNPVDFESPPVVLQTSEGPVTCQLYRADMVVWDRAIDRPDTMSVETGDNLCKQAGVERRDRVPTAAQPTTALPLPAAAAP
jgi:hypothetical protein